MTSNIDESKNNHQLQVISNRITDYQFGIIQYIQMAFILMHGFHARDTLNWLKNSNLPNTMINLS